MAKREGMQEGPGDGNGHKRLIFSCGCPEQVAGGVYANSMMVQHSPSEFIMDFAMVVGGTDRWSPGW